MSTTIPSAMKAWVFSSTAGGIEKNLELRKDVSLPPSATSLKTDQVLVKTLAMSLNPADYKIAEAPILGRLLISKPASPGLDFSGRIVAVGPESGRFKHNLAPGELIMGHLFMPQRYGSLGEYVVCTRDGVVAAPEGMSAEDAACVGTAGLTAYQSLAPYVKKGDRVFINGGSGGVGLFGIQIAKCLGCHVTTTCSSSNFDLCKSVGADQVIDYRTADVVEELKKSDHKYDLFIDNVGVNALYWAMNQYTNQNARCVQVATDTTLADILDALKRLLIPNVLGGPRRKLTYLLAKNDPVQLALIGQWMQEGKIRAIKDEVFTYSDAPRAFERLKTHRARGKIVINAEGGSVV